MAFVFLLLAVFIVTLFFFQLIFFEITRSRALKVGDISWFLTLDQPFHYTRTGYMAILCTICYMFNGIGSRFSATWFLYLALFIASGIIADAVVQYLLIKYGRFRCRKQLEEAHALDNRMDELDDDSDDFGFTVPLQKYDEMAITKRYVTPNDHLAFMSIDQGAFAKAYQDYPSVTYDVEPYSETSEVQTHLEGTPVKATRLTKDNKMPFKDNRIDVLMNEFSNYDKYEIQRVLKPGGVFLTHQFGSENLKELLALLMPLNFKNSWNKDTCAQTLEEAGFTILDRFEDISYIRFHNLRQIRTYFKKKIPEVANDPERYKAFYLHALEEIKQNGYYQMTTHIFLVVARKNS